MKEKDSFFIGFNPYIFKHLLFYNTFPGFNKTEGLWGFHILCDMLGKGAVTAVLICKWNYYDPSFLQTTIRIIFCKMSLPCRTVLFATD